MVMALSEFELESLPEYESEWEFEGFGEGEWESEEFFGRIAALARRAARSPRLRQAGAAAAKSALGGLGDVGGALAKSIGFGDVGQALGKTLGGSVGSFGQSIFGLSEFEDEFEWELDGAGPASRAQTEALMEHLGRMAAEAESDAEAEAFIGALVPLAAKLLPTAASALTKVAPQLIRGVSMATRTLRRSPQMRPLVRTMPTVLKRTAAQISRQAANGQPVTPQSAVRTLARQTAGTISSPRQCVQAYQRSKALDRRFHQMAGRAAAAAHQPARAF